jgi:uncharacterized protein
MRRSRFDVLIREFPGPGEHVLYNTLRDAYVGLDDGALALIERCEQGDDVADEEREVVDALAERGFLVRSRADDDTALHASFERATGDTSVLEVTVMPTAACNLACTYCYQNAQPTGEHMASEVEEATLAWIEHKLDKLGSRRLALTFFGGEPLLRKDHLKRFARSCALLCGRRGVQFDFGMISNGTLLDAVTLSTLRDLGLRWVKITLDGDRSTHDLVRIRRGGQGTFDRCMQAVRLLVQHGVQVNLGGNFSEGQVDGFLRLLDHLEAEGLKERLGFINLKPALDTDAQSCTGCSWSAVDQGPFLRLLSALETRGFPAPNPTKLGPCDIHVRSSFTIDEQGYVYKCGGLPGHPEASIGHVRDARTERRDPIAGNKPWRMCGDCPYVPSCHGGCLAALYLKTGMPNEVNCERRYFQETALEIVKQRYQAEFHPPPARDQVAA